MGKGLWYQTKKYESRVNARLLIEVERHTDAFVASCYRFYGFFAFYRFHIQLNT